MKNLFQILVVAAIGVSVAGMAQAAGYQLNEYSATGMGRAFAGMGIVGDDFSAIGYNPAGMSINKTSGAQLGMSVGRLHSNFKGYDVDGVEATYGRGHTNITRALPSGFVQYKLTDDLTAGLGVYVPFGLATDYPNGWFAERHGALSQIDNTDISPAIAYQINSYFSVGASVNLQHSEAHLTSSSADLRGKDWGTGYSVGMTIRPIEALRFGVSYRSKVSHHLKGKIRGRGQSEGLFGYAMAKITTPETAILSGAWDVNDRWTLSGTARWTRWKRFDVLDIAINGNNVGIPEGSVISSTNEKWRNTGFYALGVDYKPNTNWTFRGGIGYDMTVIRSSLERTPRIPDGRRFWGSLGLSYAYRNMQFDAGYAHIWVVGGHARGTDNVNLQYGRPNVKYSSDANMFSLGIQYKF